MTRRVIEGTPGNLTLVRPADLPTNADGSYLRRVRLVGRWGARRSLRYVDIVDSVVDADLSRADIEGIESRHSDWSGATLTAEQVDACSCSVDILRGFIAPAYKDYFVNTLGVSPAAMDDLLSHNKFLSFSDADRRSWTRLLGRWSSETGLTKREVAEGVAVVFSVLPRTKQAIADAVPLGSANMSLTALFFQGDGVEYIEPGQWSPVMRTAFERHDRWALARACEEWALDTRGVRAKAFCKARFPTLDFKAVNLDAPGLAGGDTLWQT